MSKRIVLDANILIRGMATWRIWDVEMYLSH